MKFSQTGELGIRFSKAFITSHRISNDRELSVIDSIKDAISVTVVNGDDSDYEKSIVQVSIVQ